MLFIKSSKETKLVVIPCFICKVKGLGESGLNFTFTGKTFPGDVTTFITRQASDCDMPIKKVPCNHTRNKAHVNQEAKVSGKEYIPLHCCSKVQQLLGG